MNELQQEIERKLNNNQELTELETFALMSLAISLAFKIEDIIINIRKEKQND